MFVNIFAMADWLKAENNLGYGSLPIPQPRDDEISSLLRIWMAANNFDREKSADKIKEDQRFTLLAYSERMASLAVRNNNQELVIFGLIALGIDGWRMDWRDNAAIVSLHYNAAQKIGVNPDIPFKKAATLLPTKAADALCAFLRRTPNDKTLEVMGYEEATDADGFRYKRTW